MGLELTRRSGYSNHHLPRAADLGIRFTVQRLSKRFMVFFFFVDQSLLQVNEMR